MIRSILTLLLAASVASPALAQSASSPSSATPLIERVKFFGNPTKAAGRISPDDDAWFQRMRDAGIDSLGMHLEAVTPEVRARIMPGKASVPLVPYYSAFEAAVGVFGRGQVSTYILAGLGDTPEAILRTCEQLVALGVYPFVVPFVPVTGTPLEDHPAPDAAFMRNLLAPLSGILERGHLRSADIKAGCGRCDACSTLSTYEKAPA